MPPSNPTPWSVYEEHLGNRGYGKPLWLPEPEDSSGIQIGDVGYTLEGKFIPIFNVIKPKKGQLTPNGFEPLKFNETLLRNRNDDYLDPIAYTGGHVTFTKLKGSVGAGAGPAGAGGGFKFQNNKQQGAALLLSDTGALDGVLPSQKFVEYIKTHYKNWWDCIRQEFDNEVFKKDEILLISGVIKTPTWHMASFMEKGVDYELAFQGQFGPVAQAGAGFSYQNENHQSVTTREGPRHRLNEFKPGSEPKDQTIFIHYYKVKFRYILPMKVVASGEEDTADDENMPDQDATSLQGVSSPQVEIDVQHVPEAKDSEKSTDPLDVVLDYILQHSEDAEMAITSTGDILELVGGPTRWPQNMKEYLEVFLPHVETSEPDDESPTRVAYLSITDMIVRRNASIFAANEIDVVPPPQPAPRLPTPTEDGDDEVVEAAETMAAIEAVEVAEAIEAVQALEEGQIPVEPVQVVEPVQAAEPVQEGGQIGDPVKPITESQAASADGGDDENEAPIPRTEEREDSDEDDEPVAGPSQPRTGDIPMNATITTTKEVPESLRGGSLIFARGSKNGLSTDWPHRVFLEDAAEGGSVCSLVVSPDARYAAAGYEDGNIRVWNLEVIAMTHKLAGHQEAVWGLTFSPDGNTLLSGGADHNGILWDLFRASTEEDYEPLLLRGHEYDVWSVAISPDGTRAATGSVDNSVKLWDPFTAECYATMTNATAVVINVKFSPDGTRLASAADSAGHIYDVETGKQIAALKGHDGVIWSIAWSRDGRRLITGAEDHTARVWDAENGDELVTIREHTGPVWSVSFSPDGKDVATGSYDASVSVCDSFDGANKYTFRERACIVNDVVYSPDGQYLAVGCADGSIKLWEIETGDLLAEIQGHKDKVKTLIFTQDGKHMVSGSDDGTVRVWGMVDLLRVV